jgi:phosphoglucomutase
MASFYKLQGKTLVDVLEDLYKKHGIYYNDVSNFAFEGASGMDKMKAIMERLGKNAPREIGGCPVVAVTDYLKSIRTDASGVTAISLPKSRVFKYELENGWTVMVRPAYYSLRYAFGERGDRR